jgi:hypothetical protein
MQVTCPSHDGLPQYSRVAPLLVPMITSRLVNNASVNFIYLSAAIWLCSFICSTLISERKHALSLKYENITSPKARTWQRTQNAVAIVAMATGVSLEDPQQSCDSMRHSELLRESEDWQTNFLSCPSKLRLWRIFYDSLNVCVCVCDWTEAGGYLLIFVFCVAVPLLITIKLLQRRAWKSQGGVHCAVRAKWLRCVWHQKACSFSSQLNSPSSWAFPSDTQLYPRW